jgi:hypothetical protein
MDLTGWILGSLLFGMGMVFGERLFHAPLLFIFVPLFIALLIVGVYLRRTKNVQSSTTAPGPENIVFVLILLTIPPNNLYNHGLSLALEE